MRSSAQRSNVEANVARRPQAQRFDAQRFDAQGFEAMSDLVALRPGTILADDYRIERTLGAGGFGITYLAEEISLARLVTIKEYFPVDFAARDHLEDVVPRSQSSEGDYSWGLDRFLAEAQTLARFTHPNIVRVYRYFLARNTGYIVLHYEDGQSLKGWLRSLGRAPRQAELDRLLEPLLGALETLHTADFLHRDIAPDNIMMRRDGAPVLIDFGSARGDIAKHSKTISALVKPGYSPYEQYATTSSMQGPWTDIYSLGATLYEAMTGKRPPDAPSRMVADELIPPGDAALSSYRPAFLAGIARSLRLDVNERPRSIAAWRSEMLAPAPRGSEPKLAPTPSAPEPLVSSASVGAAPSVAAAAPGAGAAAARASALRERPANGGLAAAFLDGWKKSAASAPPLEPAPVVAAPASPPSKSASPAASPARAPAAQAINIRAGAAPAERSPPVPEPGARKASPSALRRRSGTSWRALAFKLLLGFLVAGAAVALQNHKPTVHREGASLLDSQPGIDVPLALLKGHRGAVAGLAYSADGQQIVSAGADATLRIWSAARATLIRTVELDAGAATAFGHTRGRAATGHKDGTVALWDIETGAKLATFKRNDAPILALAFAGRPERIAAAGQDGDVAVWDASLPASPVHLFAENDDAIAALAFAERGPHLASGGADGKARLWHLGKSERVRTYSGHESTASAVAFDADGRTLATGASDGQIRLWSTFANRQKRKLKGHQGPIMALAFGATPDVLVSGGHDGTVRIWNTASGKLLRTWSPGAGPIAALSLTPDGRRIAVAGSDGVVRIWDATLPKPGS